MDSVRSVIETCSRVVQGPWANRSMLMLDQQIALQTYLASGMLRKVIEIPAFDRCREWREWQADKKQIDALEAEERRLGIQAKAKFAEVLRGIGGGAFILGVPGVPSQPIGKIGIGQLAAVNVVSRWQLTLLDFDENLTSPTYGEPAFFEVSDGKGGKTKIHPSRVVTFKGDPIPYGAGVSRTDVFWGASRLQRVLKEVGNSDEAQAVFSVLLRKAKLLRVGIPKLTDFTATDDGETRLKRRLQTLADGENILGATVFQTGDPENAEEITDYQITWAGIPEVMDAFDKRVAAVADIPYTRLMGVSPAGMNATGQHDTDNWNKMIAAGQKLELRPCLDQLDIALIGSAGIPADKVTWKFSPLDTPSEQEVATTFDKEMDAIVKLQNTRTIPERAFAEGVQNLLSEREYVPGLDQVLAKLPEDQRYGMAVEPNEDDDDPSALTQEGGDPPVEAKGTKPPAAKA